MKTQCMFLLLDTNEMSCGGNKPLTSLRFFLFWIFVSEDTFPLRLQYKFYFLMYLWVQSLFSFLTHFSCCKSYLSDTTVFVFWSLSPKRDFFFFYVFMYIMDFKLSLFETVLLMTCRAALQRRWRWKMQCQRAPSTLSVTPVGDPLHPYPAWEQTVPAQGLDLSRERTQVQHGSGEEEEVRGTFPQVLVRRKNDRCVWPFPLLATVLLWQFHPKCIGSSPIFLTPAKWKMTLLFSPF